MANAPFWCRGITRQIYNFILPENRRLRIAFSSLKYKDIVKMREK